jgi:hypothetical protein
MEDVGGKVVAPIVPGWSSVMTMFLFFTSVQLFALAMIGEYVGRIFMESKRRPLYVVRAISAYRERRNGGPT